MARARRITRPSTDLSIAEIDEALGNLLVLRSTMSDEDFLRSIDDFLDLRIAAAFETEHELVLA